MTHSKEVLNMKSTQKISPTVDSWIAEQELPVRANLKVIRRNKPNYGLTEDEIQDRNEFIRCYLLKDFEFLMMLPKQAPENDFFIPECEVTDDEYSAFNTHDFQNTLQPFKKYAYAMKKIMERVKHLATLLSSFTTEEGRQHAYRGYESLIEYEFRSQILAFFEEYQNTGSQWKRQLLKQKVGKLNRKILECRSVWERFAPPENWDT